MILETVGGREGGREGEKKLKEGEHMLVGSCPQIIPNDVFGRLEKQREFFF